MLSVEGKDFFSIVAKRLAEVLLNNQYINTSVQAASQDYHVVSKEKTGRTEGI